MVLSKNFLFLKIQINGQILSRELSEDDVIAIWVQGLKKPISDVSGYAQFRQPSGMVRLNYNLKEPVDLAEYVLDPFFSYVKSILGDVSTYTCKVLHLHTIPQATIGSEVDL